MLEDRTRIIAIFGALALLLVGGGLAAWHWMKPAPITLAPGAGVHANINPVITRNRRATGRWKSSPGVVKGDKTMWIIVDVASNMAVNVELRGYSARMETVYATAKGNLENSQSGGTITTDASATGPLAIFDKFDVSFAQDTKMLMSAHGQSILFTYSGM